MTVWLCATNGRPRSRSMRTRPYMVMIYSWLCKENARQMWPIVVFWGWKALKYHYLYRHQN